MKAQPMFPPDAKKLLTVIIPAYNVAPYIAECVESVLRQPDCERRVDVIVVIDGATDRTEAIVREVAGPRSHVRIIVQVNAGLSAARNAGVSLATTDYVTFLDGDDVWEPDYLAVVMPVLSTETADIVEYDARLMDERSRRGKTLKIACAAVGESVPTSREEFVGRFLCYTWARIYRRELVRRYPFPVGARFEDLATTPWYYWHGQHQFSIGRALIGYRQRPHSILKCPSSRDVEDLAATTRNAADMYRETRASYWQRVAYRAFQQACRRTTWQPFPTWAASLRAARDAIVGVPAPPGFARWLQINGTLIYTAALYVKRLLSK